jgi:hypothetical protein
MSTLGSSMSRKFSAGCFLKRYTPASFYPLNLKLPISTHYTV